MMAHLKVCLILLRNLLVMPFMLIAPRNHHKIVFGAWFGKQFAGGPKYLLKYIVEKGGYHCVWIGEECIRDIVKEQVPEVEFVLKGSRAATYHLHTAKFIICNVDPDEDFGRFLKFRRPFVINTTHGLINKRCGVTMLHDGKELKEQLHASRFRQMLHDLVVNFNNFAYYTICWGSTSSVFMRDLFMHSYPGRYTKETFLTKGQPTCDFFITERNNAELRKKLKSKYAKLFGVPIDKKWYLYVPGWRHAVGVPFTFVSSPKKGEYDQLLDEQNAIIIDKEHPMTLKRVKMNGGIYGNFYVVSPEMAIHVDIQELMFVCDRMISDFSSIYYDFALLNRPVIEFIHDYDFVAKNDFGLEFDLKEYAPGPFAFSEDEFIKVMRMSDEMMLAARTDKFFTHIDCEVGGAREAMYQLIKEHT